jgi:hypothetical protein
MTPTQTAHDILGTIQVAAESAGSVQIVAIRTLNSLRQAIANAVDEEECLHRLLARCRALAYQQVIRCQVQADADAAMEGAVHPRSEDALVQARELLASLDARLGVEND